MPWICSAPCQRSRSLPVAITVDFNETAVVRLLFGPRVRVPEGKDVPHGGTRIVEQHREPAGPPLCSYCDSPALWQEGGETPIRRIAGLTAELLYQHNEHEPFVQFRGANIPEGLVAEIIAGGWVRPDWHNADLKIPAEFLRDDVDTDTFEMPVILGDDGLYVHRTGEAAAPLITALRTTCASWGIPLAGPRHRTLTESM